MKKTREILRLKWALHCSHREIAASVQVSNSTVSDCLRRATQAGLSWPLEASLDDAQLEALLYSVASRRVKASDKQIDWSTVHQEMQRKGVTLQLLWYEYRKQYPEGIGYSRYCSLYRDWRGQLDVCMRQCYKLGEKLLIDYAGMTLPITVAQTGELDKAQIFVATLGASNYLYVEATASQNLEDWIGSHVRAFDFFQGVPELLIIDNLAAGVKRAHRYEPDINPSYLEMANHYGVAVMPTRVASPRDKAKAEQAVQQVERQILAPMRNRQFFSLYELNRAIIPLRDALNQRPFQKLPGSRLEQYQQHEKAALHPLPSHRYEFARWKQAKLGVDYHIDLSGHYYSAPYRLIKQTLTIRYTKTLVEIYHRDKRVASHRRAKQKGGYTTVATHMPKAHQEMAKWTPERIIRWAKETGCATAELAEKIIASRQHPQQGFRACMGLIRLGKSYTPQRLDKACQRALAIGSYSYKSVQSILKKGLDQLPLPDSTSDTPQTLPQAHDYIRGHDYFN